MCSGQNWLAILSNGKICVIQFELSQNAVTKLVHFNFIIIILQFHFPTANFVRLFAEGIAHVLGITYLELHRLLSLYEI